jgi:hypothetical protein
VNEVQLLADAISNAAPVPPPAGGVCVISDVIPGAIVAGVAQPGGRSVRVTGLGGSPEPIQVPTWSQTFDDRITALGTELTGRRVFVLIMDRQPFIVDLVSAPVVTAIVGG